MAVESAQAQLGMSAPTFSLPDTEGATVSRTDFDDAPALLVMFICNHCPFVKHVRDEVVRLAEEYQRRGAAVVAISANDPAQQPADGPEAMRSEARSAGFTFPYLFDASQEAARAYGAVCTPDFFLFDAEQRLAYRGQLDDSRPGNGIAVTGKDLRAALDAVLDGRQPEGEQRPSVGCSIKWRTE